MNRSGKLKATNDSVIIELINSPYHRINTDGTIDTCITVAGNVSVKGVWRKLNIQYNKNGYGKVCYKNIRLMVHRVIYAKFKGLLSEDLMINHVDNNPKNNKIENLELVTAGQNNQHRFDTGYIQSPTNNKITKEIADLIREDRNMGMKYFELCKKYSLTKSTISFIINYKIWK